MARAPGEREGGRRPQKPGLAWSHGRCLSKGGLAGCCRGAGRSGVSWGHPRAARAARVLSVRGPGQPEPGLGRERARVLPHRPPEGRGRARVLGPPLRPRDRRGQGRGGTRGRGRADPQAAGRTDRRRGSPAGPGRRSAVRRGLRAELAGRSPQRRRNRRPAGPQAPGCGAGRSPLGWAAAASGDGTVQREASLPCVHPDRECSAPHPLPATGDGRTRPRAIRGFSAGQSVKGGLQTVLK